MAMPIGLSRRPTANPPKEPAKTSQGVLTAMATVAVTQEHQPPDGYNSICLQQDKDKVLMAVKTAIQQGSPLPREFRNQRDNLVIEEGRLYRRHTVTPLALPDLQVVVLCSLRPTIQEQLHNEGGHLGTHKTAEKLRERYYWPDYMTDVEKCQGVQAVSAAQQSPRKAQAPLETIQAEYPFQKISWDIMGPLLVSAKGHKYILVVTDLFTKWVEAFPLCSTESTTLATVLVDEMVCRYGVPTNIRSDQGANFTSAVIQHLCSLL